MSNQYINHFLNNLYNRNNNSRENNENVFQQNSWRRQQHNLSDLIDNYYKLMFGYNETMNHYVNSVENNVLNETYQNNIRQYNENIHDLQTNICNIIHILLISQQNLNNFRTQTQSSSSNLYRGWLNTYFFPIQTRNRNTTSSSLTEEQINNSTQTVVYDPNVHEPRCPITMEDFVSGEQLCKIRHCGHVFKRNALHDWLLRDPHCPMCRFDIRTTFENNEETKNNEESKDDDNANDALFDNLLRALTSEINDVSNNNYTYTMEFNLRR